jgi:polyketide biosynthesis enoyl-CoA hydratase PksI
LVKAFEEVGANERYRCVVLTGYDGYFACGGSFEGLMSIQSGAAQFTDVALYSLPLECPVPVISCMQGHGIGGGFVLGLFADLIVLAREGVYTTNFMKYGFTPGMGATLVVPEKLGIALGTEMLLTARTYRGEQLRERGVACAVLPRAQVLEHALELARELAQKPRASLVLLKEHLAASIKRRLPEVVQQEVAMHDLTFHQADVKERIASLFGQ